LPIALVALLLVCAGSAVASAYLQDIRQLKARILQFAVVAYPRDGKEGHAARLYDYAEAHPELLDHGLTRFAITSGTRVEHARLLLRLGQETKAREVLGQALAYLDDPANVRSEEPAAAERNRAVILKMLGRDQEASAAFTPRWPRMRPRSRRPRMRKRKRGRAGLWPKPTPPPAMATRRCGRRA
jgi:hypothetical protein